VALLGSAAGTAAPVRIAAIATRAWRSWIPSKGRWYYKDAMRFEGNRVSLQAAVDLNGMP